MVGKFYEQNKHVITELGQSVRERWVNNWAPREGGAYTVTMVCFTLIHINYIVYPIILSIFVDRYHILSKYLKYKTLQNEVRVEQKKKRCKK